MPTILNMFLGIIFCAGVSLIGIIIGALMWTIFDYIFEKFYNLFHY